MSSLLEREKEGKRNNGSARPEFWSGKCFFSWKKWRKFIVEIFFGVRHCSRSGGVVLLNGKMKFGSGKCRC